MEPVARVNSESVTPNDSRVGSCGEREVEKYSKESDITSALDHIERPEYWDFYRPVLLCCREIDNTIMFPSFVRLSCVNKRFHEEAQKILEEEILINWNSRNPLMPFSNEFAHPMVANSNICILTYFYCRNFSSEPYLSFRTTFENCLSVYAARFITQVVSSVNEGKDTYTLSLESKQKTFEINSAASTIILTQFIRECLIIARKARNLPFYEIFIKILSQCKLIAHNHDTINSLAQLFYRQYYSMECYKYKYFMLLNLTKFLGNNLIDPSYCNGLKELAIEIVTAPRLPNDLDAQINALRILDLLTDGKLVDLDESEILLLKTRCMDRLLDPASSNKLQNNALYLLLKLLRTRQIVIEVGDKFFDQLKDYFFEAIKKPDLLEVLRGVESALFRLLINSQLIKLNGAELLKLKTHIMPICKNCDLSNCQPGRIVTLIYCLISNHLMEFSAEEYSLIRKYLIEIQKDPSMSIDIKKGADILLREYIPAN